jgi:hypothetical protein
MPTMSTSSRTCHPERSATASNASRRAQSKDPCAAGIAASPIEEFSQCCWQSVARKELPVAAQETAEMQEILRLRALIRARSAQDDNAMN